MRRAKVLAAGTLTGLLLAGCENRGKVNADASAPVAPPPAASAGPVNPDPRVTRYACADGETVTAGYPDRQTAVVTYRDHAYTLKLAGSGEGARYTGYGLQWRTRGDRATLSALKAGEETARGPGLDCRSAAPAGESMTCTALTPAR